jgi:hypothetical protein
MFTQDASINPLLTNAMQTTMLNFREYQTTEVFTDDRAPIEWIVNDMVVRFVLGGNLDSLQ